MVSDVLNYRYLLEGAPIVYVPIPTRCSSSRSGGGGFSPSDDGSSGTFYVHLRTASCIATCEEPRGGRRIVRHFRKSGSGKIQEEGRRRAWLAHSGEGGLAASAPLGLKGPS